MGETKSTEWPAVDKAVNNLTPRNERRAMVRVQVRTSNGFILGGGLVPRGEHFVLVYESEIARLPRYVWTERTAREYAGAVEQYERELAEWQRTSKSASREVAESTFGRSIEAIYYERTREEIPPIEKVDVMPEFIAAPDTPESRVERTQTTMESAILSLAKGQEMIAEALKNRGAR